MISRATDLRVEVLAGSLVLSRTDCTTRAAVVKHLAAAIARHATVVEGPSVRMPMDVDDLVVPDLVAVVAAPSGGGPVRTQDIELAVEVVPRQEKGREFGHKADWYAVACVRALLVVDPRYGTWALHTEPDRARYRKLRSGCFGDTVPTPYVVETAALPVYDGRGDGADECQRRDLT
ncbi:Uma2 family endonuclease [Streptomyces peucetius]|uniref:Uma2 family endonuclease n=1 Tax=Streptomyces peucetius TaxID=1950 RepID=A0ABY6I7R8_STRPE|nr:Uma2 family endonuclease [Streptomyces peucetius]UYQ63043.1 Uma2 family endonuclease [Streptomyces peucetius]